jgi:hypothetical protein
MAGEQILLPFPVDVDALPEDPVSPEQYREILAASTVGEVRAAFRGERVNAHREELPEEIRKTA